MIMTPSSTSSLSDFKYPSFSFDVLPRLLVHYSAAVTNLCLRDALRFKIIH